MRNPFPDTFELPKPPQSITNNWLTFLFNGRHRYVRFPAQCIIESQNGYISNSVSAKVVSDWRVWTSGVEGWCLGIAMNLEFCGGAVVLNVRWSCLSISCCGDVVHWVEKVCNDSVLGGRERARAPWTPH